MVAYERIKVATGHNNTGGYQFFTVDPNTPRVNFGIVHVAISGKVSEDGDRSAVSQWLPKVPDSVIQDVCSKTGLSHTTISANVTVYLPSNANRGTWSSYNAVCYIPPEAEYRLRGWEGFIVQWLFLDPI